jgi:hypothetical protein
VIRYEVILEYSDNNAPALEHWMRNIHIPHMLDTGCFAAIHFDRSDGRFHQHFPDGVAIAREVWEQPQNWALA